MRYLVIMDQIQNLLRIHPAQEHVHAGQGSNGPGIAPAIAMKHRQRPQIHRVIAHAPGHLVAQSIQVSTAVMVDHPFRVARSAGGIVKGYGLPLIAGPVPVEVRVAFSQEDLVIKIADCFAFAILGVVNVDDQNGPFDQRQRLADHRVKLAVGDQYPGFAMIEHERNGFCIQAHVQGIEHSADHGHAEVRFKHCRDIGQHHGDGVPGADPPAVERRSKSATSLISLLPVTANSTVYDGRVIRVDGGRTFDEAERCQGDVVYRGLRQAFLEDRHGNTCG